MHADALRRESQVGAVSGPDLALLEEAKSLLYSELKVNSSLDALDYDPALRVDVEAGRPESGNRHDYPRPTLSPLDPQGAKLLRPEAKQSLMDRDGCPVLCDHFVEKTVDRR